MGIFAAAKASLVSYVTAFHDPLGEFATWIACVISFPSQ